MVHNARLVNALVFMPSIERYAFVRYALSIELPDRNEGMQWLKLIFRSSMSGLRAA